MLFIQGCCKGQGKENDFKQAFVILSYHRLRYGKVY